MIKFFIKFIQVGCFIYTFLFPFCFADTLKGSFYANPILDVPTTDEYLIQR